ncbi:MAG: HDOD domain-containing protein [Myxococcota bacterium]
MFAQALAKRKYRKGRLEDLPSFPAVVADGLRRLRDPNLPLAEAGETVAADPAVSAKVLKMANSTAFALRHPVRSVPHAASLLGRGALESLLLGAMVSGALPAPAGFDARAFWTRAAKRALIARAVAKDLAAGAESEAFTLGLLQDMAVLYLLRSQSDYARVYEGGAPGLHTREQCAFGYDHATVAGWMAEQWELPANLVQGLSEHHSVEPSPSTFVAHIEHAEEEGFLAAASDTFGVDEAQAKRWWSASEEAGAMGAMLR